jgi:hypothetical protein
MFPLFDDVIELELKEDIEASKIIVAAQKTNIQI